MATHKKKPETVWVVVLIQSGIPVLVEVYKEQQRAEQRERLFRQDMREDYDEVGIFKVQVGSQVPV